MKRVLGLALALILGLLQSAFAQTSTGNIYGTVSDESGAVLPGATIKLSSPFGTSETTAGTQGDFRFLNLTNGTYKLTVNLAGFTTVTRDVQVNVGMNVNLSFSLKVATVEETVTVTVETPIVDTKKVGTATTLTKEELAQIPSARDPWAMLRTVPGIVMDRVNIGGNENGQQANFVGKGDNGNNVMWNLDGVVITDTGSLSSPAYYDFDAFEEVAVGTGGHDVRAQTGGVNINLSTRRGTNAFHGSAHG
jgi:Carboxypeptidase regulatory-like domain